MKFERSKKVAEEIRREVSEIVQQELSNPHIHNVALTSVRLTPDLKLARVYFALPGAEAQQKEIEKALQKSAGYVRRLLAKRIHLKYIPQIEFFYDETLEIEAKMEELFAQLPPVSEDEDSKTDI